MDWEGQGQTLSVVAVPVGSSAWCEPRVRFDYEQRRWACFLAERWGWVDMVAELLVRSKYGVESPVYVDWERAGPWVDRGYRVGEQAPRWEDIKSPWQAPPIGS